MSTEEPMERVNLGKFFDHKASEEKWYKFWEGRGYFKPTNKLNARNYCIVIPPPNITGALHLGHALNNTLQDILIRYHRMLGENVLWQPGTDHAGIATQYVVEKELRKEGLDREVLGREKFIERVWKWKEEKGGRIIEQLKRLGASCDWSRLRFTMDEGLSRAVREVFVRLYEEGLIYRGDYLVNFCPSCGTALSQLEVELSESDEQGSLWYIKYPFVDGSGYVVVATTRPETMLGDTAVAVNPDDNRYKAIVGKMLKLPCTQREIPVIADSFVDKEFGTGALKITPGHDFNDYEIGLRHNLPVISVIDFNAKMCGEVGKYLGMDRYECRREIVKDLSEAGLLEKIENYPVRPGKCYRCHTVVEPLLSTQWFVRTKPLAIPALEAVKSGKVRIIPESEAKKYIHWMENIRDWCISRQIWWGHQIPAWYCRECGYVNVSREDIRNCLSCNSERIERDPDVLDTWFSSALWPFSTLGFPDKTEELARFYPNSAMVTGFDILYFWVARMMMTGIKFMGEVPFYDIYLHGLVRDEHGFKFSKTRGNVIDPIELIDEYGADALRFSLAVNTMPSRDLRLSEKSIEDTTHFINKIWNASKFILSQLGDYYGEDEDIAESLADRWISSRLARVILEVRKALDEYGFQEASLKLYHFFWDELCDWYIEWVKPFLYQDSFSIQQKRSAKKHLLKVLENSIRLLHPFMPFLTEEIWQALPVKSESIMIEKFPEPDLEEISENVEAKVDLLKEVVSEIRRLRSENMVPPGKKVKVFVFADDEETASLLNENRLYILSPPQVDALELNISSGGDKKDSFVFGRFSKGEVCIELEGMIEIEKEEQRLNQRILKLDEELMKVEKKLSSPEFISKAPFEIIEKQKKIKEELSAKRAVLVESLQRLKTLSSKRA